MSCYTTLSSRFDYNENLCFAVVINKTLFSPRGKFNENPFYSTRRGYRCICLIRYTICLLFSCNYYEIWLPREKQGQDAWLRSLKLALHAFNWVTLSLRFFAAKAEKILCCCFFLLNWRNSRRKRFDAGQVV